MEDPPLADDLATQLLDLIRSGMSARSVSNADLAGRLGVSKAAVSNALSPRRSGSMTVSTAERYCRALGLRLTFSVELEDW